MKDDALTKKKRAFDLYQISNNYSEVARQLGVAPTYARWLVRSWIRLEAAFEKAKKVK